MAKPKTPTTDKALDAIVDAVQEEAKPAAKLPKAHQRPSMPDGPFVNSSFAERAKTANKRIDRSESEAK